MQLQDKLQLIIFIVYEGEKIYLNNSMRKEILKIIKSIEEGNNEL